MSLDTLTVGPGVELAYTDSGAPAVSPYTTIFALHGMAFSNLVFKKLSSTASDKGYRFVAINRRSYPGSTAFTPEEVNVIVTPETAVEKRQKFIEARGQEIASFIDVFAQKHNLPPISNDDAVGGSIVFGWSLGSQYAAAALAYIKTLPEDVCSRLSSQIRSVVVYEAPPHSFGLPAAQGSWSPVIDSTLPENVRMPLFGQWVSSYFDNGDYSKRDRGTLAYALPSTDRAPSIFKDNMNDTAAYGSEATYDLLSLIFFGEPFKKTFRNVFGGSEVAEFFPKLKKTFICGDRTASFALDGMWIAQDDLKEARINDDTNYKLVKGANHFLHWDDPEKMLESIVVDS